MNDYYRDRRTRIGEVRNFLHRLGIKSIRAKDSEALFRKQMSLFREARRVDLAEAFDRLRTPEELIAFAHSDLLAAKIVLGGDFERILSAGEFVTRITLDKGDAELRILDVGGGLGQTVIVDGTLMAKSENYPDRESTSRCTPSMGESPRRDKR